MTKHEVTSRINQILSTLPEDQLEEVLAYLEVIKKLAGSKTKRSTNLIKIMREDRDVLQKLAK